jgi:hypothetical protein
VTALENANDIRGALFVSSGGYRTGYKTTTGKILSSRVVSYYEGGGRGRGKREQDLRYRYAILYSFAVAGKNYTSHEVDFTSRLGSRTPAYAQRYTKKYPVGRTVTVYYKADEPSLAVLEPQNRIGGLLWFLGLLAGFILSLLGIWYARKSQSKSIVN